MTALTRRAVLAAMIGAYVAGMGLGALLMLAAVAAEPTPPCRKPFPAATWLAGGLNGSDVAD